tara:strand:- start:241 stop:588 length:348 start_codon:yes stop_codon:yes gene_type:complete
MWNMAHNAETNIEAVLPDKDKYPPIKCRKYGPGCLTGITFLVRGVAMIFVRFDTEKNARRAAIKINAYYSRNWLFDDVLGEPILEDFVIRAFGAIRALPASYTYGHSPDLPEQQK